ncbi:MAG: hypothetical protein JNL70_23680 [Saprospiraceae bacterium]|nr:hypothetical protein [Saprospiraceae bacterium]
MLGYIFYGLTCLVVILFANFSASKPNLAGEGAMAYGLLLVFFGLAFAISSLMLTLYVGGKNGFDWISIHSFNRNILVGLGWLCMAVVVFACGVFKWEWYSESYPQFLHGLAKINGQVWLPLFMLVPYLFLLNTDIRANVSPNVYKIPLMIGFLLVFTAGMGLLFGWLQSSAKQQTAILESHNEREIAIRNDHLQTIANHKTTDNILYLMSLTGRFHDEDIRAAAVAKVKEKPHWEDQLIELLENKHYYAEAYTFLDGNKVDNPEKFLEPLNRSILFTADEVHHLIKDADDLQEWHFEPFNIDRLLRAIDEQFLNKGMDFRPALLKLQEALQTTPPERFKNVRFKETLLVKDWLKRHK